MSVSKEQTNLILAGAAIAVVGYGIWSYVSTSGTEESAQDSLKKQKTVLEEAQSFFTDEAKDEIRSLYKTDAISRAKFVSDARYRLAYAFLRGGKTFEGKVTV